MTRFFTEGIPVAQGSKNAYVRGGRAVLVETSKKLPAWRAAVTRAAEATGTRYPQGQPLAIEAEFVMPRTKAMRDKPAPPMTQKPDLDKCLRAIGDALTNSGMIQDDSHSVTIRAHKRRAQPGEKTGCWLTVAPHSPTDGQTPTRDIPGPQNATQRKETP